MIEKIKITEHPPLHIHAGIDIDYYGQKFSEVLLPKPIASTEKNSDHPDYPKDY